MHLKLRVIISQEIALWKFVATKLDDCVRVDVGDSIQPWNHITEYVMMSIGKKIGEHVELERSQLSDTSGCPAVAVIGYVFV